MTHSLVVGERTSIWSDVLGEERPILISVPPRYASGTAHYPVLYLLDADGQFEHLTGLARFLGSVETTHLIPELIVVGVLNTDRTRDMTPSVDLDEPSEPTGGAAQFRKFLTEELAPYVDTSYRTATHKILAGHSYAGLFTVNTLLTAPSSFDGYIAMDPSLWWQDSEIVGQFQRSSLEFHGIRSLYLATAGDNDDSGLHDAAVELDLLLKRARPAGLRHRVVDLAGEDHGSMPHRSFYEGLEFLYEGWRPDALARAGDVDGILAHYAELSTRFGLEVMPPWTILSHASVVLEDRGDHEAAVATRTLSTQLHPNDNLAHRDLGETLRRLGRLEESLPSFVRARDLVVRESPVNHEYLLRYTRTIDEVKARLADLASSEGGR